MANTLVQFRADDAVREQAIRICNQLGIDLQTYMRMCLVRLIQENGIPFSMKLEARENEGIRAIRAANQEAEANGVSDMSLEEINAEIAEARKQGLG